MGGLRRTLVGLLIGAALGGGTARAVSLSVSFNPSPDSSTDTYLALVCQGDATVCTQDSYTSGSQPWTQVSSQPASVVCATTPCGQTFSVADPAPGQVETLTVALVAESQAANPTAPLLSGPSNVISVTLNGASTSSSTLPTTSTTRAPTTTTSTSSTPSSTRAPTTTTSTSTRPSTTGAPTTTTTAVTSTTLVPSSVCGYPYRSRGGVSMGWDTYAGVPCDTGDDPAGYLVVDAHVYAGQPGDPPTLKLALYESNGGNSNTEPAGTPLCESDIVTLTPG